ncbi:MAG TPA: hypothetical protein DCM64_07555 [Gammaproteobacteria bacterium]|nr:hypothetical protein [Gammaproteobacteria bacterium]
MATYELYQYFCQVLCSNDGSNAVSPAVRARTPLMNSTLSTHRLPAKTRLLSSNLLFLSLVVGFVIIVLSLVAYALNRIESQTRQSNGEALETVLYTTEAALELWQDQLITYVSEAAQNPQLVQSTIELLDSRGNQALDLANSALGTIRSLYQFQFERNLIQGIFVISPDAISIASMREENMGSRNIIAIQRPDLFGEVFEGRSLIVPPIRTDVEIDNNRVRNIDGEATMFAISPIRDTEDVIIAALAVRLDPGEDFTRITQLGRIGESGETYAFDRTGLLITESRFDDQLESIGRITPGGRGILAIRIADPGGNLIENYQSPLAQDELPLTVMAASATSGNAGSNVEGYRDYRGVEVFGVWLWSDELGIGLTTEIDSDEVLAPYYRTRTVIIWLVSATISLMMLVFFTIVRHRYLREQDMLAYQSELEGEVQERTEELITRNRDLEQALVEIDTLGGLLPICASCKNIRDDKGYWEQIESYISKRPNTTFSHGICPSCKEDFYQELKSDTDKKTSNHSDRTNP